MLDHDQGVAEIAQPDQGLDQPAVVPLVQPDARLVQHVQHPDQARSDLGGQPDPLGLTAGQARGRPAQRQVVQAHVEQELQPLVDLLEHPLGDLPLTLGQFEPAEEGGRLVDRHVGDLGDVLVPDGHRQRGRLEPGALAGAAGHLAHVPGEAFPGGVGLRLGVPTLDVGDHAFVLRVVAALPAVPVLVAHVHLPGHPVQQHLLGGGRQPMPGNGGAEAGALGQRVDQPDEVVGDVGRGPGRDRSLGQALLVVGHHQVGIDLHPGAQPVALRAGAPGPVEGELPRLQLVDRDVVVVGAGHLLGVVALPAAVLRVQVDEVDGHDALGQAQRGLHRVGQPLLDRRLDRQPVHDDVDVVLVLLVQDRRIGELDDLAIHPGPAEPAGGELAEDLGVLALPAADHRGQDLEPGALRQIHQPIDDLLRRLPADRLAADRAVRPAGAGVQQPQVVVDLGDGAHGRARVAAGRLLIDGDGRRQPLDEVDIRLVHLAQELARVRRERLDVAALALGEDRVERQAGLARAGQPGEYDQRIPR